MTDKVFLCYRTIIKQYIDSFNVIFNLPSNSKYYTHNFVILLDELFSTFLY